jgi:hypothetical protein
MSERCAPNGHDATRVLHAGQRDGERLKECAHRLPPDWHSPGGLGMRKSGNVPTPGWRPTTAEFAGVRHA